MQKAAAASFLPSPLQESFYCFGCDALDHGLTRHGEHVDNCPAAQGVLSKEVADLAADAAHEDEVYGYGGGNDISMDAEQQQEHVVGDSGDEQDSD